MKKVIMFQHEIFGMKIPHLLGQNKFCVNNPNEAKLFSNAENALAAATKIDSMPNLTVLGFYGPQEISFKSCKFGDKIYHKLNFSYTK